MTFAQNTDRLRVGIVGATGLVGRELIDILVERNWPIRDLALFASRHSEVCVRSKHYPVAPVDFEALRRCDLVFLMATSDVSRAVASYLADSGVLVVDNSSAYRLDPSVPLIVPEINSDQITGDFIANPNCSTILLLVALAPLHRAFGCVHANVATYQAVSGAGAAAIEHLMNDTRDYLGGGENESSGVDGVSTDFTRAFNVWSHESTVDLYTGVNGEENKMILETQKVLDAALALSVTCIRVPVERAHGEAVSVLFERPISEADVRRVLTSAPGLRLVDDRSTGDFPTARMAAGKDAVMVGRLRIDRCGLQPDGTSTRFQFWLTGDQVRKGAALNAAQIVEQHPRFESALAICNGEPNFA